MTKPAITPHPHWSRWIWPVLLACTIFVASSRSQVAAPGINHIDKVGHFLVYGLLGSLVCRTGRGWRAAVLALLATSLFGVSDEWHQSFTPGRSVEFADWLADTLGAALGITVYTAWPWYRRLMETPLFQSQQRIENSEGTETLPRA